MGDAKKWLTVLRCGCQNQVWQDQGVAFSTCPLSTWSAYEKHSVVINPPSVLVRKDISWMPATWQVLFLMLWAQRLNLCGFCLAAHSSGRWRGDAVHAPNTEALSLKALAVVSSSEPHRRQFWISQKTAHTTRGISFLLGSFPHVEISEPITQNSAYMVVGKNQKHPEGSKGKVLCAKTDSQLAVAGLALLLLAGLAKGSQDPPAESPQSPPPEPGRFLLAEMTPVGAFPLPKEGKICKKEKKG